ncbi:MAG TPA: hypothetical protein VF426_08005 [Marmoricola sp.]
MSGPPPQPDDDAAARAARRRRLEEIFGTGLPDQTADDLDDPGREADEKKRTEEWLRRQVPPHHG